ncbi:ribonuclease domain-containing protein [Alkalimonas amylolytica]|uniref:Guanyl-specific ribonuclease Sa n=1 Tax=Alkalimonas amylolytica TaxID=152573 RepID=A0A1H4E5M7_ALKAM|nr:ribonuclease domain-containing protein [Alkalimonas amylolytica]SEA80321.1 Guanyl-specific ribonuclease Sa [Alkalimonas amylolytica]
MKKLLVVLLVLAGLYHFYQGDSGQLSVAPGAEVTQSGSSAQPRMPAQQLELQKTLQRIQSNGPFPYDRDGITFHNRERLLPIQPRGYYREYTVDTPGLSHRGPRRVVTGGNPPVVFYYTEDHYQSFRRISGDPYERIH